jgi:hypothetical protein
MKEGYEFKGSNIPLIGSNTIIPKANVPRGNRSIMYSHWINQYCKAYPYLNKPLDANAIAGFISTENGSWNPLLKSFDFNAVTIRGHFYQATHSQGLGMFTRTPWDTAKEFQLYDDADQCNPEKNIKAICWKVSKALPSANGNYTLAYEIYNSGSIHQNPSSDVISNKKRFVTNYNFWAINGQGKIAVIPSKTNNNMIAVDKAKQKAIADNKAYNDLVTDMYQLHQHGNVQDNQAVAKAKLTNDAKIIAQTKKQAEINRLNREKEAQTIAQKKKIQDQANALILNNAYKSNNPIQNTPSTPLDARNKALPKQINTKPNYIKSGIPIIGVIAMIIILNNAFIQHEELE